MIVDFRFANFRSFHGETRFCTCSKTGIKRVVSVYGANASGKTNLVKALSMMRGLILDNASNNSTAGMPYQPFAFAPEEESPYLSELTFELDHRIYRYGYQISRESVLSEWLFESDDFAAFANDVDRMLFSIEGDDVRGDRADALRDFLPRKRPNMLMLAKMDQENDQLAGRIMQWFKNLTVIQAYSDPSFYRYSHQHILMGEYRPKMMEMVRTADPTIIDATETAIGRVDVATNQVPAQIQFARRTVDGRGSVQLPFDDFESSGTQKMFLLSGPLVDIFRRGGTVVFDELDSKLHPNLMRTLVGRFKNAVENPHAAQLIFTTHDVELMRSGAVTKDEIFFCDKNLKGESALYALADFETSGKYESKILADKYLEGVFGAVPEVF